jgi:dienelactone hydrolase
MVRLSGLAPLALGWIVVAAAIAPARAQIEFPPPQGKGHVAVVVSGHAGAARYEYVAAEIARLGYDAVLFDANDVARGSGGPTVDNLEEAGLRAAIAEARQAPHALPGKVALVGFSQGGGQVLFYGSQMPDVAAGIVAWYPVTRFISDIPGFAARLRVPVLMFAGANDYFAGGCCRPDTARTLAAAAAGRPFDLVVYPDAKHDFIYGGLNYNAEACADAMRRTAARLAQYLGR